VIQCASRIGVEGFRLQGSGSIGFSDADKYLDARLELIVARDFNRLFGKAVLCALQKLGLLKV
jgi:hypothetical protein